MFTVLLATLVGFGEVDRAAAQSKCRSLKFKVAGATAKRKAACLIGHSIRSRQKPPPGSSGSWAAAAD